MNDLDEYNDREEVDEDVDGPGNRREQVVGDEDQEEANNVRRVTSRQLKEWRDGIAQAMWDDYVQELVRRGLN